MLCSIPADTVNTDFFKLVDIFSNDLLNILILTVKILHIDIALSYLCTIIIAYNLAVCMPVFCITKISLDTVMVACKMVGNNVHDNLDTIFVSFLAQLSKLFLCAEVLTYCKAGGLIKPVPGTLSCCGLNGRGLDASKASLSDLRKLLNNIAVLPVETMKYSTILNIICQTVICGRSSACGDHSDSSCCRSRHCSTKSQAQYLFLCGSTAHMCLIKHFNHTPDS